MHINKKISAAIISVSLLAISCSPFSQTPKSGIVKTTNGGVDWQLINTIETPDGKTASISAANVGTIVINPKNRKKIYAAVYNGGVLRSEDSGETWTKILANTSIYDVIVDPGDENRIYAAGIVGNHGRVLLTTDGGKSWKDIFTESSVENPVRKIVFNPAQPKELIIGLQSGTIIRSPDGGSTWQLAHSFDDRVQGMVWLENGTVLTLIRDDGLWASSDGGVTYTELTDPLKGDQSFTLFGGPVDQFIQFAVSNRNPDTIYLTTDTGLHKTQDGGKTWKRLPVPAKKEIGVRAIGMSLASENTIYVSSGATVYKSVDGGDSYQTNSVATNGFINYIVVDPELTQVAYAGLVVQ